MRRIANWAANGFSDEKANSLGGFTAPFSRYIGPGNRVYDPERPVSDDNRPEWNLQPLSAGDELARIHDIEYSRARTIEDVQEADNRAIQSARELGGFHGYIINKGLSTKQRFENIFGQKYPQNLPHRTFQVCITLLQRFTKTTPHGVVNK